MSSNPDPAIIAAGAVAGFLTLVAGIFWLFIR
jgi:hypothetical protein